MRKNPKIRKLARKIIGFCRDDEGRIVPEKMTEALAGLRANPPRDYRAILRSMAFLTEREIAGSTARVTSGAPLTEASLDKIRVEFSRIYGQTLSVDSSVESELIAGTRVQVGDDLYEISISGRLAAIGHPSR